MKKGKIIIAAAITACVATGCVDHMPGMTEEQTELVAEYAADLLLKYSPNYQYRLTDEEELEETEQTEDTTEETTSQQSEDTTQAETTQGDTQTTTTEPVEEVSLPGIDEVDFAEAIGIEGIRVSMLEYEITESYPMKAGTGFSVNAGEGNQLVVMHFSVENTSSQNMECNLYEANLRATVTINGVGKKILTTLLTDDIATYEDNIPAGEAREVVAVLEVGQEQAAQIDTMSVSISGVGGTVAGRVE